jgi:prepilin-type N-terminal cleavage/methylation domain-containing protein
VEVVVRRFRGRGDAGFTLVELIVVVAAAAALLLTAGAVL